MSSGETLNFVLKTRIQTLSHLDRGLRGVNKSHRHKSYSIPCLGYVLRVDGDFRRPTTEFLPPMCRFTVTAPNQRHILDACVLRLKPGRI